MNKPFILSRSLQIDISKIILALSDIPAQNLEKVKNIEDKWFQS